MTAKPSLRTQKPKMPLPSLNDWIAQHLAPTAQVQMRLRGNILHVLCETPQPLHQGGALLRLVEALLAQETASGGVITSSYPQVYQLYIYSRRIGQTTPDWTAPIYLNRLERHHTQLQQSAGAALSLLDAEHNGTDLASEAMADKLALGMGTHATAALVRSQLSLAQEGDPDAIAWYLSEVLSTLDVGVWVSVRAASGRVPLSRTAVSGEDGRPVGSGGHLDEESVSRLWVWCEATYSPDPLLIAEPVTERLRQLSLTQFKDAVVVIQVHGEDTPDWSLRIDLTPAEEMLREWGRWGDEAAIARLLTLTLADFSTEVLLEHREECLHCFLQPSDPQSGKVLDEAVAIALIAPLMDDLAPQGIHRMMVYGQARGAATPTWVRCLNLPALEHPALNDSPTVLAQQGDLPALAYLLTRLLNPDLDAQLATGGIRVQVLRRDRLLHIMTDAPICPTRRQIVPQVLDLIDALNLWDVRGIRLYGRRSGQQRPTWSYGKDFRDSRPLVPQSEPTFAVSESYVGELLTAPPPEEEATFTPESMRTAIGQTLQRRLDQGRKWLLKSQLFVPQEELSRVQLPSEQRDRPELVKIGLVWSLVGMLLALQTDWILGQVITPATQAGAADAALLPNPSDTGDQSLLPAEDDFSGDGASPDEPFAKSESWEPAEEELVASPAQALVMLESVLSHSPYPSFRSQQMDEKLALYHQRLAESGPPDVLVIGSSRALRGVDPAALRRELAALGHGDLSIFNFGVNGATAQVVDLTLRQVLEAEQLPRLIVWADGARAFNSGRTDVTFNAIASSDGYRELGRRRPDTVADTNLSGTDGMPVNKTSVPAEPVGEALRNSYTALDKTLSDGLGSRSAVYADRDELKAWVRDRLLTPLVAPIALSLAEGEDSQNTSDMPIPEGSRIDFDGFLALDVRFNPATYYQLYARVPGVYDSDYEDFRLEGEQTEAFERLLRYTHSKNIPVVFINTPLTDEYLDSYRREAEDAFQKMMLTYSASLPGFIYRDLGQVWTNRYDYFSDPSHLNRYGAYQVSLRIAQDPMIPWPKASDHSVSDSSSLAPEL